MPSANSIKILLFDIETAPNLAWVWGKYEQNVIDYEKEWHMLCFAYKWLGEKEVVVRSLPDFRGFKKNMEDDRALTKDLWKLVDQADVLVAHNGDSFDIKKINTRFTTYGLFPPSPYKTIDTRKIAKKYFGFNSNKLNDLGVTLGLGEKVKHEGFEMWKGCMSGDKNAWKEMTRYNKQDVVLLEKIYNHFLPWISTHPNLGMYTEKLVCPKCGSGKIQSRGYSINKTTKYKRIQCQECGGWGRLSDNFRETKPIISI